MNKKKEKNILCAQLPSESFTLRVYKILFFTHTLYYLFRMRPFSKQQNKARNKRTNFKINFWLKKIIAKMSKVF